MKYQTVLRISPNFPYKKWMALFQTHSLAPSVFPRRYVTTKNTIAFTQHKTLVSAYMAKMQLEYKLQANFEIMYVRSHEPESNIKVQPYTEICVREHLRGAMYEVL